MLECSLSSRSDAIGLPQLRRAILKKYRCTEEWSVVARRDAEARTIAEAAHKHGVCEPWLHRLKKQYADIEASDVHELKQLKSEIGQLMKLLANETLKLR